MIKGGELKIDESVICEIVSAEFGDLYDQFFPINKTLDVVRDATDEFISHPGVYIFWDAEGVIKVGRHFTNARKRALEHIRDDTGKQMKVLENDPNTNLLLFVVKDPGKLHWVAALEVFLEKTFREKNLGPRITSKRLA